MGKIGDFFTLLSLKFVVTWRNFVEYITVIRRYYVDKEFRQIDIYLLRNYLMQNPYRMSKEFLKEKGEGNIYQYGETPLTTLDKIAKECDIGAKDRFYELGSGRGRSCFWIHCFRKCRGVIGVEYIPAFVKIAAKTCRVYQVEGVKFIYRNILDADMSDATVIYFYGTSSETAFILKLIDKLKNLPSGTRIITVSYPLTNYTTETLFEIRKVFSCQFTWGETEVYLQVRK
jgi:SAM-dependent methyltransferase